MSGPRITGTAGRMLVGLAALASMHMLTSPRPGAVAASAGHLPQGAEPVTLDPARFGGPIDHPWWPMLPGSRWVYRETDQEGADRRVEVVVTGDTRTILGIAATVVRDTVSEDGEVIEDTFDWYAQDDLGNVWYLGEATGEYEDGALVTTEGSWEAGVDGAQPGIALPGAPVVGMSYRQEYLAGEAEDAGRILATDLSVAVPHGRFDRALMTADTSTLDPDLLEVKVYAPGVGPVLEVGVSGGADRAELLTFEPGR